MERKWSERKGGWNGDGKGGEGGNPKNNVEKTPKPRKINYNK